MQNTNVAPGIPQTGFVRLPAILAHIPVSRSTWWAGVRTLKYPAPVKSLGKNITAWRAEDIHALIARLSKEGCAAATSLDDPEKISEQERWRRYEVLKEGFLRNNPGATPGEYERAMRLYSDLLGL